MRPVTHRPPLSSLALLLSLAAPACRSAAPLAPPNTQQNAVPPAPPPADADAPDTAPAADATLPDAPLAVAPAEPPRRCGEETVHVAELHPLERTVFSQEQREPAGRRGWRVPAQLGWLTLDPDPRHSAARVVLGALEAPDCALLTQCEEGEPYHHAVHGPFAGVAGSDLTWTAHALCGPRLLLGLFDAAGVPHALRDAGERFEGENGWTGRGVWLDALDAFPDGNTAVLGTYETADGSSTYVLRVWSALGGELRELGRERMSHTMGAPFQFTITRRGEPGPTPTVLVTRRAGRTQWSNERNDDVEVFGAARTTQRRYDPARHRFR